MATSYESPTGGSAAGVGDARVVDTTRHEQDDPPDPWEVPATASDMEELATHRFKRLPHRPASLDEVPAPAVEALQTAVGTLEPERLFLIPRSTRSAGTGRAQWYVTPTRVIAVGDDALAIWTDDPAGTHLDRLAFVDILAILDRTILLYGRLELFTAEGSVVVRYNAVGRPELRQLLLPARRSAARLAPPVGTGVDPDELPHKWMALLRSSEVQPLGTDTLLVAAGDLRAEPQRMHDGVAVLTSRELLIATDPTSDPAMAHYGVDLVAVPRSNVTWVGGVDDTLRVGVAARPRPLELLVTADPALVASATRVLGPAVEG